MIVQSHVANGNYEILSLVFVNLMDSLFAYENRCVFHLEVLNTLTYLWFPKNNISSERLPMLKRKFVEYNIGTFPALCVFELFLTFSGENRRLYQQPYEQVTAAEALLLETAANDSSRRLVWNRLHGYFCFVILFSFLSDF